MKLTPVERDAVLAGLRLLQRFQLEPRTCVVTDDTGTPSWSAAETIDAIASDSGETLSQEAIDALCERFNQ